MKFWIKNLFLMFMMCFLFSGGKVYAQSDLYSVIYNEVFTYNGNPQEAEWITQAILYASDAHNVDPLLVTSVMEQESHFNINVDINGAYSSAGAIGPMQLMPGTANMIGVDPYNPLDNIIGGVIYLKNQLDNFAGWGQYAVTYAVAAYNAGSQAVKDYGGVPPYAETQSYVVGVADKYNRLLSTS